MSKSLKAAAARVVRKAGGPIDVGIVLGSGLSDVVSGRIGGTESGGGGASISYDKLDGAPLSSLAGHPGVAHVGTWGGKRVVAFAGRAHLYQGKTPEEVAYFVRLAAAAGARTVVLTNAAGGLNPSFARGDLMLLSDHLNLTGATAIAADDPQPFLNMLDAYSPRLRALAHAHAGDRPLREGVYAGLRGPAYETLAEAEMLRRMGADAVGMSTVLETMAARNLGLEVLGLSLITNVIGPTEAPSHVEVLEASKAGGERIAGVIEGVLGAL
jgi:purine-nucleoside phosphorylase